MSNVRKRCVQFAVFYSMRAFSCILRAMPIPWSLTFMHGLAWLTYMVDRRHRRVAIENLKQAFPGQYTDTQLEEMTLGVYRHFFEVMLELDLIPRKMRSRRWRQDSFKTFSPELRHALTCGRPLIVATAHYGNWELTAYMLRFFGRHAHLVARDMDNPWIDKHLRDFRECIGHTVISKHGDVRRMIEVLRSGGVLCTLCDQDAGARGMFVDFFGKPASTHKVIASLAKRTGALIVVTGAQQTGGLLEYTVHATDVIDPNDYADHPDADFAITQRMSHGVERLIRFDPRQYLWLHRRWKHQPPVAKPALSAAA